MPDLNASYRIVDEIAAGGMGAVYLGLRTDPSGRSEPVAIKRLHQHLAGDSAMVESFVDEANIASRLDHPNLVRVHEIVVMDEELVIVMDWVEGIPLSALVKRRDEPLPIPAIRRLLVDALEGLHFAHELTDEHGAALGVVHRDISPQNLLVGSDGRARVTDFGIALAKGRLAPTTIDGGVKGKLPYLSPEQVNRAPVDRRCDLFAFGAVAWELCARRRLFEAGTEGETLAMVLREPITPPSSERIDVPLDLDETILRALERKPERRFATAADFAEAITEGGPLATHEEVGRIVIASAGTSLAARRQKLAYAVERPAPPRTLHEEMTATLLALTPIAPPPMVASIPPRAQQAPARSSTPLLVGVVIALCVAIGVVVKYKTGAQERVLATAPDAPVAVPSFVPADTRSVEPPPKPSTIELPSTPASKAHRPPLPKGRSRADAGAARQPFMPDGL